MTIGSSPVQEVLNNTWTSSTTFTFTVAAIADGNCGIIRYTYSPALTVASIAQTGSNWLLAKRSNTNRVSEIWYTLNYISAGTTITLTMSGTPGSNLSISAVFQEWNDSGGTSGWVLDATGANASTSTTPTSALITPTSGRNALIVAGARGNWGAAVSGPTNGFTNMAVGDSTTAAGAWLVAASTSGSYSTGWTKTNNATWDVAIASFIAPASGGAPPFLGATSTQPGNGAVREITGGSQGEIRMSADELQFRREERAKRREFIHKIRRAA